MPSFNGEFAQLKIINLPETVEWEIDSYDNVECVREKHRVWS